MIRDIKVSVTLGRCVDNKQKEESVVEVRVLSHTNAIEVFAQGPVHPKKIQSILTEYVDKACREMDRRELPGVMIGFGYQAMGWNPSKRQIANSVSYYFKNERQSTGCDPVLGEVLSVMELNITRAEYTNKKLDISKIRFRGQS